MVSVLCCRHAMCHDKSIFSIVLQAVTLSSTLDYNWLCPSINIPQQNTAAWFNTDISTKPDLGHCAYLSYISWWQHDQWQHDQWQHCVIVIVLLPGNRYLTCSEILLLFKAGYYFAFVLILQHEFQTVWKCGEIHLNGVTDRNWGADTSEAINKSNEYLSFIRVTHTFRFKIASLKKHSRVCCCNCTKHYIWFATTLSGYALNLALIWENTEYCIKSLRCLTPTKVFVTLAGEIIHCAFNWIWQWISVYL